MKKFFPINTTNSCRLKWSWSTLVLSAGVTSSCYRSSTSTIPEDFDSFHNTPRKIKDREQMLQGVWPGHGCEYCRDIEASGGTSERMFQNSVPNVYPAELDADPTLTVVDPSVVEVHFANTCNLGCVYCRPKYSSFIQNESLKFGSAIEGDLLLHQDNQYRGLYPKFLKWLGTKGKSIKRLNILGGEPFLQSEINDILKLFDQGGYENIEFNIVSNLSVPEKLTLPLLDRLSNLIEQKKLGRVDIQASIDCWGEAQTYTRYNIDLNLWEKNLSHILDRPNIRLGLLSTVNSLGIKSMPELAKRFLTWNQKRKLHWYMHFVLPFGTSDFDPTIFDYSVFDQSLTDMKKLLPNHADWDAENLRNILDGIDKTLRANCRNDIDRQRKLYRHLQENDRRRGLNWRDTFPWLLEILEKNHVV